MTVAGTAARHPGHHRAIYSKTVAGNLSFLMAFGSPLGPWGAPKPPQPVLVNLFGSHFKPKSRKRGIQKGIPKIIPKNHRKKCRKAAEILTKWKLQSKIGHASQKKANVEQMLVFPRDTVFRARRKGFKINEKCMQNRYRNKTWKNNTKRAVKRYQTGDQNRIKNERWDEKGMHKNNAETGWSERWPKNCKVKEKELTSLKSAAGGKFGARRKSGGRFACP